MVKDPLLSVIVPFYNVESYIRDCLESLRVQTLTDLEVIMVDDGSLDGSIRVAQEYVALDPRFRLVRQENQGLGPARNSGTAVATGRYLTFVDSDDIVAPRAYSRMVGSLEDTGSDLVGGNAYRFSAELGVYQSWTHREPFERTRLKTSIDAFPQLMRDRMVWNKVYRRSYWDEQGFRFPAIRYEDYPVTLPAYLRAGSVDVLADHVYFWRDRESGDSITQQAFRLDNVRDRVASARLVLDGLDEAGKHRAVRRRVHAYFVDIDLVALAEALVNAPDADQPELEELATSLADRLERRYAHRATRLARLIHRSLQRRDLELTRALARWRGGSGNKQLIAEVRTLPHGTAHLPAVLNAVTPRKLPQNPLRPRRLRSMLAAAEWRGDDLHLTIGSRLRASVARRATARARLSVGRHHLALVARTVPAPDGVRWQIDITPEVLQRIPVEADGAELRLSLRLGLLRWSGAVQFDPADLLGARRLADGSAVQLFGYVEDAEEPDDAHLLLARLAEPVLATEVRVEGATFVFDLDADPGADATVVVARPDPTPDVVAQPEGRTVRLAAVDIVADDPPDDPVTGVAVRPVLLRRPDGTSIPLHLAGDTARIDLPDRTVELTVALDGSMAARQERSRP